MDSPFIAAVLVFAGIYAAGTLFENWSWSKPLFTIGVIILIIGSLASVLR